jgi:hypothetical protein
MSKDDLIDFFSAKRAAAGDSIDWEAKKNEWIKDVEKLYDTVENEYLAAAAKKEVVSTSRVNKDISEEFIGKYSIPELRVCVGDEQVVFSPKGRNIVGAAGRIDLIGDMGEKTLVLQPRHRWGIVVTRTPTLKVASLDKESLLQAFKEIMRA